MMTDRPTPADAPHQRDDEMSVRAEHEADARARAAEESASLVAATLRTNQQPRRSRQ